MIKRILFLLLFFVVASAYAGEYEDAMAGKNNIFLYFYTPKCISCAKFEPIYNQLSKQHKAYKFIKINAQSDYGISLLHEFKVGYVPYVVLVNPKSKMSAVVNPYCSFDNICMQRALKNFN